MQDFNTAQSTYNEIKKIQRLNLAHFILPGCISENTNGNIILPIIPSTWLIHPVRGSYRSAMQSLRCTLTYLAKAYKDELPIPRGRGIPSNLKYSKICNRYKRRIFGALSMRENL